MLYVWFLIFGGCQPEDVSCTAIFAYSSTISLYDLSGEPIVDAEIGYTVNGVDGEYIENFGDGSYAVGGEEAGDFVVDISVSVPFDDDSCCWDVGEARMEYTIEADSCHVIGKSFTPDLEWDIICADTDENGDCG